MSKNEDEIGTPARSADMSMEELGVGQASPLKRHSSEDKFANEEERIAHENL